LEGRARVPPAQRRALRGASLPGAPATAAAAARTAATAAQERARQLPDAGRGRCRDDPAPPRLAPVRSRRGRPRHRAGPLLASAAPDGRGDRPVPRDAARAGLALRLAVSAVVLSR